MTLVDVCALPSEGQALLSSSAAGGLRFTYSEHNTLAELVWKGSATSIDSTLGGGGTVKDTPIVCMSGADIIDSFDSSSRADVIYKYKCKVIVYNVA